jgi:hypothetical protein
MSKELPKLARQKSSLFFHKKSFSNKRPSTAAAAPWVARTKEIMEDTLGGGVYVKVF